MKHQLTALIILLNIMQASANETNEFRANQNRNTVTNRPAGNGKHAQYRVQLMHKALKHLEITEEQQQQIVALQKTHAEKIRANARRTDAAGKKLAELQDSGAARDEIARAIDEISEAQKERLWILTDNRMEMERILGKEKYKAFMEKARKQYRAHGRRGGLGMPPRPDMPSVPGERENRRPHPPPPREESGLPEGPAPGTE
ncbi:MAG TPA: hypothetical protein VIR77_00860 [Pontiella sp.]